MEKSLPKPELNPLTNPILGRNLERWASVYFNAPPEQRDHAVSSLLHELEEEANGHVTPEPRSNAAFGETNLQEVACPACGRRNQPYQKFCGICGSPFSGDDWVPKDKAVVTQPPPASEKDVEWLRERAFSSLDQPEPASNIWKYLIAVTAIVLSALVYLQWGSRPHSVATPAPPPSTATTSPEPTAEPAAPASESPAPTLGEGDSKAAENSEKVPPAKPAPAVKAEPDSPPPPVAAENGAQELHLAQNYLQERSDSTGAVKLLWKAVGKQNTSATLLLADLYARGEGVPKSCDQARLLLVAAAKKGVSEAAQKLRSLESSGCQ